MTDEEERLLAALEPFRREAKRAGYEEGKQQGVLMVYNAILHWSVRGEKGDIDHEERTRRIRDTETVRILMEEWYPIIRQTYPKTA